MTSDARAALTRGVEGLRAASLAPVVRASDPAGDILRRGVAISAYNLLETFIEGRLEELTVHINLTHLHFADLSDRLQQLATQNLLNVASARARRMTKQDVRTFVEGLGRSLAAVHGGINLSSLTWLWSGSNMGADDFVTILKAFHVKDTMRAVDDLAHRFGFPKTLDPKGELHEFGQQRHRAAHNSAHQITNLWIPSAIDQLVKFSITFDAFASVGAGALRRGDADFLADDNWTTGNLGIRRITERANGVWAEHTETGGTRAVKIDRDLHTLTLAAAGRCTDRDILVISDQSGQIIDWSIPQVG
ncbi:hypothetical protein [Microbacterium sp. NPDC090014]|uniref:hypothetical protein n=1 Tax=Microbacterium sp. NPDC090014 TaxID=3364205 RepID=UPI0038014AA4